MTSSEVRLGLGVDTINAKLEWGWQIQQRVWYDRIASLPTVLREHPHLQSIVITYEPLESDVVHAILEYVKCSSALRDINLSGCGLPVHVVESIRELCARKQPPCNCTLNYNTSDN